MKELRGIALSSGGAVGLIADTTNSSIRRFSLIVISNVYLPLVTR